MKKLFLVLTLVLCGLNAKADGGDQGGGGGSLVRATFISKANRIADLIEAGRVKVADIEAKELRRLVAQLDVIISESPLILSGQPVDAVNFLPEKLVVKLHNKTWQNYFNARTDVDQLVLHELLPYFGVDDSRHQVSSKVPLVLARWACAAHCARPLRIYSSVTSVHYFRMEGEDVTWAFEELKKKCYEDGKLQGGYTDFTPTKFVVSQPRYNFLVAQPITMNEACLRNN